MKDKLILLKKLQSGELELGEIEIDPELFFVWIQSEGYKEFGFQSYAEMKSKYCEKGKPINTTADVEDLIKRMKNNKNGRLILAKAMTEIKYGTLTDSEKWECYSNTRKLGFCPLCGWKPGEGIKTCYYSSEIGAVIHQNSDEDAKRLMTESQRSLIKSYDSYRCGVMSEKTCDEIKAYLIKLVKKIGTDWEIGNMLFSQGKYNNPEQVAEAWIGNKRSLEKYLSEGYEILKEEIFVKTSFRQIYDHFKGKIIQYEMRIPHTCGGYGKYLGPYHIGCSGCKEEVKLWEFGIDYDIG